MSQYINFYLRMNDKFVSLGSYTRSHVIYNTLVNTLPYEKITAINEDILNDGIAILDREKDINKRLLKKNAEKMALVADFNNSVAEKMEEIENLDCERTELEIDNKQIDRAIAYFEFLKDIIEEYKYDCDGGNGFSNDWTEYIYAGIEATGEIESIV